MNENNYILISPTFTPDPREKIVPFRYVLTENEYHYTIERENWVDNKWAGTYLNQPFDKKDLLKAVKGFQSKIKQIIDSWKWCQYDKGSIKYEL